jgi:hypothetical protein
LPKSVRTASALGTWAKVGLLSAADGSFLAGPECAGLTRPTPGDGGRVIDFTAAMVLKHPNNPASTIATAAGLPVRETPRRGWCGLEPDGVSSLACQPIGRRLPSSPV